MTTNAAPEITDEQKQEWRNREYHRLYDGTYVRLPLSWRGTVPCKDHFAHVSTKEGAMVAFTENDAKGVADRQTVMKPGKYLTKFFSHCLTADQITEFATAFCAEFKPCVLSIAKTADDIEHVYTNGPSSCMSYMADDYSGHCHPVRAYGDSDLSLAYIERGTNNVTARALIWEAKKRFGRIYGDEHRILPLLEAAGYTKGSFVGARICLIEDQAHEDQIIMPYIDFISCAGIDGQWLVLGDDGLDAHPTCGTTRNGPLYSCDNCGDGIASEDEMFYCEDDNMSMCEACDSNHRFYCECLEENCAGERYEVNGQTWSQRAFDRYGATCQRTDLHCAVADMVEMANGDHWSQDAFATFGATCAATGERYEASDCVTLADGTVWHRDHFEQYGATDDQGNLVRSKDAPADKVKYRCPDKLEMDLDTVIPSYELAAS